MTDNNHQPVSGNRRAMIKHLLAPPVSQELKDSDLIDESLKVRVDAKLTVTPVGRACFTVQVKEKLSDLELKAALRLYGAAAGAEIRAINDPMPLPVNPKHDDTFTIVNPVFNESGRTEASQVQHLIVVEQNVVDSTKKDIQQALSLLIRARHCMSYDDDFCGEGKGKLKSFIAQTERDGAKPVC